MATLVTVLSSLALAGGSIGYFTFPMGLEFGLKNMINLKENGMVYPLFMNPPFASTASYRIFSITNPREVLKGGKMSFKLKGPFYYKAYIWRDNISNMKQGEILKYDSHRTMILDEQNSADLDEKYWMLNPIFAGVQAQVKSMVIDKVPFKSIAEPIVFNSVNVLLDNFKERLIVKKSARQLLEGTKVELLESLTSLADRFGLKSLVPPGPPQNMFGLAHTQNHTVDTLAIYTGLGQTKDKFGEVLAWNGKSYVPVWNGKCQLISGTNGELHKPMPPPGKPLTIFLAQLCRTFNLDPVSSEPVMVNYGVRALEYEITGKLFQGSKTNPSNRCFCKDTGTYDCQYDGLMSMGPCFFDAPLFFAKPNFKGMDRRIRSLVNEDSLNQPMPDKMSFYIEPITGSIVKANITFVGVFKVNRQPYMRDLARVQNLTYAPLFTASESIDLPYSVTWQLKYLQMLSDNYGLLFLMMAGGGAGLLTFGMLMRMRQAKAQPKVTPDPNSTDTEQSVPKQINSSRK